MSLDNPETPRHPLRVVIMEDNAIIAMLLGEVLLGMGHEVCAIVATEQGGVVAAARHRPDLLIVDVQLDSGSGVAAVAAIIQERFVPHIFVSGERPSALDDINSSAVFLEKPYQELELLAAIDLALSKTSMALALEVAADKRAKKALR